MLGECIVVTRFASTQPGFLDFSYRIKALAAHYQVTVLSEEQLTQPELQHDDVRFEVLPQRRQGRLGWILYMLACVRLIRRRRPARVVLLHSLLAPMAWLLQDFPTALYWNEHPCRFTASPPQHPYLKRLARRLALKWAFYEAARRAALVMPIGEAHHEDLLDYGIPAERVRLLHMGVAPAFTGSVRKLSRAPQAPLRLIYVGTVSKARGRDVMLEALAIANRERAVARLTIIGACAQEKQYCEARAQELGIADAVQIRGRIPGEAVPGELAHMDAGLCLWEDTPWWRFNPPTKLFEYLVAGLPVLASEIRTHTQYISHWRNGLIFEYDPASLAICIRHLWERRTDLHGLKMRAQQSGQPYQWSKIEPQFLQAIDTMTPFKQRGRVAAAWKSGAAAAAPLLFRDTYGPEP